MPAQSTTPGPVQSAATFSPTRSTSTVVERKHHPNWKVIVKNDDVNTFQHVVTCFVKILPQMIPERALGLAMEIHTAGSAVVWTGPLEQAEMYHEQLGAQRLHMAPLEKE